MKSVNLALALLLLVVITTSSDCFQGEYYDNSQGSCQQCDISCATCNSNQGCTCCYTQMYLTSRGKSVLCDLCYNIVKNCQVCISAQKCSSCSNGFLLDSNNACQSCSTQLPNCLFCFQNSTNSTIFVCIVFTAAHNPMTSASGRRAKNAKTSAGLVHTSACPYTVGMM